MSPGEGGNEGSGSIQDAYWWRRCEVPESRGRRRDCYMCVTFSDQVLNEGLFSGFSGCRYLDRSTTYYPSSEPVLWHNWAWSDWYISNATEISWRPLQAPYTDPTTGLRYHDKSVYEYIKSLVCFFCWIYSKSCAHMRYAQNTSAAKEYLSGMHILSFASAKIYRWLTYWIACGVNSIVK